MLSPPQKLQSIPGSYSCCQGWSIVPTGCDDVCLNHVHRYGYQDQFPAGRPNCKAVEGNEKCALVAGNQQAPESLSETKQTKAIWCVQALDLAHNMRCLCDVRRRLQRCDRHNGPGTRRKPQTGFTAAGAVLRILGDSKSSICMRSHDFVHVGIKR